jgi:hypothetical protein
MPAHTSHRRALLPVVLLALLCLAGGAAATPWSLTSCDPAGEPRWHAFEQEVRTARPGSTLYVPKPYPKTDVQVVADYLAQYRSLHFETKASNQLPANEGRLIDGIRNQTLTYQVMRMENWTQMRCGNQHKQDHYNVIRVFDAASGVEISRAVAEESGLLVTWMNLPTTAPGPAVEPLARDLPTPDAAMAQVNTEFGLQGADPEWVATWGTLPCSFIFPCLAFHQNGLSYLFSHHEVFEVSVNGPELISGRDVGTSVTNEKLLPTLTSDERLVSLGGPAWTIARKASPEQIRRGISNFR